MNFIVKMLKKFGINTNTLVGMLIAVAVFFMKRDIAHSDKDRELLRDDIKQTASDIKTQMLSMSAQLQKIDDRDLAHFQRVEDAISQARMDIGENANSISAIRERQVYGLKTLDQVAGRVDKLEASQSSQDLRIQVHDDKINRLNERVGAVEKKQRAPQ